MSFLANPLKSSFQMSGKGYLFDQCASHGRDNAYGGEREGPESWVASALLTEAYTSKAQRGICHLRCRNMVET